VVIEVDVLAGVQVAVEVGDVGHRGPDDLVDPLAVDAGLLGVAVDVRLLDALPAVVEVEL